MTKRQAQNVASALGGVYGLPTIRERSRSGNWEVVIPIDNGDCEGIPRRVVLRTGGVYLQYGAEGDVTDTQAVCWPTDKPQSFDEERYP